jgi:adenylate cyclase
MDALSLGDVAEAAGLSTADVMSFVVSGALVPDASGSFHPSDIARVRLVASLVRAGLLDLDALTSALADGRLSLDYVDLLMPEPVRLVEVEPEGEDRAALALEEVIRPILGSTRSIDGRMRSDDLAILSLLARAVELGAPSERVVRIVRSMARAAATLVALQREFVDDVLLDPTIERTGSPIVALQETASTRLEYRRLGRELTGLLMDRLVDDAIFTNLVQLTEFALTRGDLLQPQRDETVVFIDVSEYTRLSERHGDKVSAEQAARLVDVVEERATGYGGRLVKSLGDGALVHSPDASAGVSLALDVVGSATTTGLWPLHAGVNTGPLVHRDGDLYGSTVNVASRVADQAQPGEVVVTGAVVQASQPARLDFTPAGDVTLKNVSHPITLYRATSPMGGGRGEPGSASS